MGTCGLCRPGLGPVVREADAWRLVLNRNQNLLGKTMLVLRRHAESVLELTPEEWDELRDELVEATRRLDAAFAPDHYNFSFLQNQDRHVHLHVIPRYASPREFAGLRFDDADWPGHYEVKSGATMLSEEQLETLTRALA